VVAFTYSRGGLVALAVALFVMVASSGARLRSLVWLAAAAVASVPPLVLGLESHALTTAGVSLGSRETAGLELALVVLASLTLLALGGSRLFRVEHRFKLSARRVPAFKRLTLVTVAVLMVGALVGVSLSSRGLGGTISHAWHTFTSTKATSNTNPSRLLSADSENRWVWWKEAAGAFSDRPLGGWGAGSFGVVHLLYRRDTLTVQQPHSVPLQFLAEAGIVGAMLALGGFVLLVASAAGRPRSLRAGSPERLLAAALLAGAVAYGVHSLYDWDWDIPAVSLPAFLFLGVLVGARGAAAGTAPVLRAGSGTRALALVALTLWLCSFALSAVLPSLAASEAASALVRASSGSAAALRSAQASARLASDLDPLSDAGLRVEATIAIHRGALLRARGYLVQAIGREPTDVQAWDQLAQVYVLMGDVGGAERAAARVIALDPKGPLVQQLERAHLLIEPPTYSVTAIQTPSPAK
jgi:O-antigen ligase